MALVVMLFGGHAQAGEGRLDRSFGDRGRVSVKNSFMAVGPQGSIALMSHGKSVVRLKPDGTFNRHWGQGGSVPVPARVSGWSLQATQEALDSHGRMLIFGSAYPLSHRTIQVGLERVAVRRGAVLRFRPDGKLDPRFGEGGAVVGDFGVRSEQLGELSAPTTGIAAGTVDSSDRPILAVGAAEGVAPCAGHSFIGSRPSAIARLTASGLLDPEFGEGDGLSPGFPDFAGNPILSIGLTRDDQPMMGGALSGGCPEGASVIRLSGEGTPLPGYGIGGRQDFLKLSFAAFAPDGGAVLVRRRSGTEIVRRATAQGEVDSSFGHDGTVAVKMPRGSNPYPRAVVDSRGRILIVSSFAVPAAGSRAERACIFLERLLPSGRPDLGFGREGRLAVPIPGARNVGFLQVALDSAGRLLVLSELTKPNGGRTGPAVLTRFLLN
jgi:uncharacterized delta-60 repeat protein